MAEYHPGSNHPWRQYRNRKTNGDNKDEFVTPTIPLDVFLKDIVDNWSSYKIPPANFEDREYILLCRISPDKQAEWLISFLKKHWLSRVKGAIIIE